MRFKINGASEIGSKLQKQLKEMAHIELDILF